MLILGIFLINSSSFDFKFLNFFPEAYVTVLFLGPGNLINQLLVFLFVFFVWTHCDLTRLLNNKNQKMGTPTLVGAVLGAIGNFTTLIKQNNHCPCILRKCKENFT